MKGSVTMSPINAAPKQSWEVPFSNRGPFLAHIAKFSDIYYEVERKSLDGLGQKHLTVSTKRPKVLTCIDIYLTFEHLLGTDALPLQLKTQYRASLRPNANFTRLLAGLLNVDPETFSAHPPALKNLDFNELSRRLVNVFKIAPDNVTKHASVLKDIAFDELLRRIVDLFNVAPEDIANNAPVLKDVYLDELLRLLDFDEFIGKFVSVTLRPSKKGFVQIDTVAPAPLDGLPGDIAPSAGSDRSAPSGVGADAHSENLAVATDAPNDASDIPPTA